MSIHKFLHVLLGGCEMLFQKFQHSITSLQLLFDLLDDSRAILETV